MLNVSVRRDLRDFSLQTDFSVGKGETLVLIGENGAGKSSLLFLLSGLLSPDSGHISLDGQLHYDSRTRVNMPSEERDIGFVFQNYALFPHMTVFENVAFGLRRRKVPPAEIRSRVDENLALLSLQNLSSVRADRLSGGQRQRVALARALAIDPALLLLDEPVSALDALAQDRMRSELGSFVRKSRIPCIAVTHSFRDAASLGDRIGLMEEGRIIRSGTLSEIMAGGNDFLNRFFCGCRQEHCHQ